MDKLEEKNNERKDYPLYFFCASVKQINKDNTYYIVRKKDNLIFNLGKIIDYEIKYEIDHMSFHGGPMYNFFYYIIEFENSNKIYDLELVNRFKKLDAGGMIHLTRDYSNLFVF